ncbi:hypothetical protein EUX98_g3597 [Antrodiella citrinella]|uniref:Protein kinase domain-containing protein n=1 Tax=Antrodiella citrinella TaxID=2447956 RepID=A0A4S4N4A6_9APHY|nr:hypothetical protein EUX98_g3597 [Antrodiella citrinella]
MSSPSSPPSRSSGSNKLLNAYQLGDCLGKGAFGQVYRALNWATGETVAIKEIQLSNIPKSEIGQIMSEIDLLKNLNHANIVKYKGFEKTREYLYIILEFCENGSLHNICKRFGKFPETLVAVYISQVLDGLVYLHDQGVIHRDIKGANILTNKDGCVKLADFGVASSTAAGAVRDDAVVGSPYWMAPEVIEQSGATTASDIWYVGRGSQCIVMPPSPLLALDFGPAVHASSSGSLQPSGSSSSFWKPPAAAPIKPAAPLQNIRKLEPITYAVPPEEQDDNWDDDFEEGISLPKLQAMEKTTAEEDRHESDDNAQTIRPIRSPSGPTVPLPLAKAPSPTMGPIVEDYSDMVFDEDDDKLQEKLSDYKIKNSFRRGLFHPDDIKTVGLMPPSPGPKTAPLPDLNHRRSRPALNTFGPTGSGSSTPHHARSSSSSYTGPSGPSTGSFGRMEAKRLASQPEFGKYAEEDDEDYDDVFGKPANGTTSQSMQTLQLNTRLSNKSWLGDEDDEEDPFAEIDEGFAEEDLESNLQRDKYARLCNSVNQLIDELTPSAPDFQLREACDQLLNIIIETPEMQPQLVSSHGMLAILEVLEGRASRDVTLKLLQIVNELVTTDMGFLESFCLIGGIPVIMGFTSKRHPIECRLQASNFIRLLCHSSILTLQMFISCRGLKVLVDLLDEDYSEQAELVIHALNGIGSVFELQSPTTKNDFCRMFIREGLLDPLSSALLNIMTSREGVAMEMNHKIIQIILVFCQVSQSDIHVRNALGTRKVVRRLLRACEMLEPQYLVHMLKAVKHLSMNATLLEVLQNANAIEILVKILDEQDTGPHSTEMANHVFQTIYNLCRLNKSRQEEAAQAGIIPALKRVIESSSPLKQFALPILCDLASAGKSCRILLWQHDGLGMYLGLLDDPYFQVSALESVVSWLQDETARVEDELLKPHSLEALLKCFVSAKAISFENLLDPFLKITRISNAITIGIAKSQFFKRVIEKLGHSKPVVRSNILRLLRAVCEVHPNRAMLVDRFGIYDIVVKLSKEDAALLVRELAREIVPTLAPALKPVSSRTSRVPKGLDSSTKSSSSSLIAPKKMRRTASESVAGSPPSFNVRSTTRNALQGSTSGGRSSSRHKLNDIPWQPGVHSGSTSERR